MSRLSQPISLRGLELENRIAISPMCQYRARHGVASPWHSMHVGMMALSGVGLAIMEATAVESIGRISHGCLGLYEDSQESALAEVVTAVRSYSHTPLGIQLAHAGRKAATYPILDNQDGLFPAGSRRGGGPLPPSESWPVVGPSAVAFDDGWQVPEELSGDDLMRIRHSFADASRRAGGCGLDMIEVHGAHGYLLHSFMSERSNRRADAYGGSVANRMRFPLEVAQAVREAFPLDKPVGYRLSGSDWAPGGTTLTEAIALAGALKEIGIDYVVVSGGGGVPDATLPDIEPGYMVDMAAAVRKATGVVTMTVGMILSGQQAEAILDAGSADLVAVGRGFIDDPKWGWHAVASLGEDRTAYGLQARVQPRRWPGHAYVHPKDRSSGGSSSGA